MVSVLKQFLRVNPIIWTVVSFCLFGCQSRLDIVGQDHALVVKKWQELAKYIDNSTTNNPFTIVGKLAVDRQSDIERFILTDIHLSQQETPFELNLIRPTFQNKYICLPVCIQLTEYFSNSQESSTMLNLYFEQHEFELFKFYGDVVLQNDNINALYELSPITATRYFNWLIHKEQKFNDLASMSQFLTLALTQESLITFLNDPEQFYGSLLAQSQEAFNSHKVSEDGISSLNVAEDGISSLNVAEDGINSLNVAEGGIITPTADETLLVLNDHRQEVRLQNWLQIKDHPLAIGDQVCHYEQNEFGTVNEIIGNQVQVRLVGKLIKLEDGIQVSTFPGDIYNKQLQHVFTPMNRVESYKANSIAACQLDEWNLSTTML